jgi:hypothetical protein
VEFCSDMFLLPLGLPPVDSIDLHTNTYLRNPGPVPPTPPPRPVPQSRPDQTYYEILLNKLEFNNNAYVSDVLSKNAPAYPDSYLTSNKHVLEPIYESHENEHYL